LGEEFPELSADGAVDIIVLKTSGDMILDKVNRHLKSGEIGNIKC
jgi:hypothetical protein